MEKYKMLQTGCMIAPGIQLYKLMSSFQDMTYCDSIIDIFLNFLLSQVKLLFEVKLF